MKIVRVRVPLSAALAATALGASATLVGALFALGLGVSMALPWWLALAAPPLCYALLVPTSLPRLSRASQAVVASLLCAGYALLTLVSAAVVVLVTGLPYSEALVLASLRFFPAPILQILCAPLILVPFRSLLVRRRRQRRELASPRPAEPGTEGPAVEWRESRGAPAPGSALVARAGPDPKRLVLERLAHALCALGTLDASVSSRGGVTLYRFCAKGVPADVVTGAVAPMLPLLWSHLAPEGVEQLTLRRREAGIVLTPAGAVEGTRAVIAVAVAQSGALAPIGTLCLRVAAERLESDRRTGSDAPGAPDGAGGELTEVAAGPTAELLTGALRIFGRFTPCVLRDRDGDLELCLFLPSGENQSTIGAFAHRAARALAEAEPSSLGPVESALFRFGERRLVLRPAAGRPGHWIALVAVEESADRGQALREGAA